MNNIIKKITVAILSMIVVAGVFAPVAGVLAATFNTVPGDFPTLQVSNYTQHPDSDRYWSTSVSANAGEIVSFVVYYYNTAADAAQNTSVRVQLPSGAFTSTAINGEVRATNASTVTGFASINLASNQTLTFIPGSVRWYQNQSVVASALPNGQNGNEILSSGLSIGTVAPEGWGTVVFRAQVSSNTTNTNPNTNQPTGSTPFASTGSVVSVYQDRATTQGVVNPNNSGTTAWFEYGTTASFGNTAGYQTIGSGSTAMNITGYLYSLSANTTYYYRVVAQNAYGTTYGNTLSFSTQSYTNYNNTNGSAPTSYTNSATSIGTNGATFNASVIPNNGSTNAWFEYGVNQSLGYTTGYQSVGNGSSASTISSSVANLAPNTTYYFRSVAQNQYGTSYGSIVSVTTNSNGSVNSTYGIAPFVTSRAANNVFRNTALINGGVNPNGTLSTAWFEWGSTAALGNRTMVQPVGQSTYANDISAVLSGLQAGTTYYYRAVAQNAYGTTYGNILNFMTTANRIVPVVVTNTGSAEPRVIVQQIGGTQSATVLLTPSIDKKNPKAGDTIEYSIQYRNEEAKAITNATMKVSLPDEVTFVKATIEPSSENKGDLVFDLGTIGANTQGVITITAKIARTVEADSALTFGATMDYTNAKKQFQSTSAYLTVLVEAGVAGLASLLSTLGNLLTNWFVDLILGLLIGFGIYHFFVRQKEEEVLIK